FRGEDDRAPVRPAQACAQPMLGQAEAVERRRVEIVETAREAARERPCDRLIGIAGRRAAERRRADTELRDGDVARADASRRGGIETHVAVRPRVLARLWTCTCMPG